MAENDGTAQGLLDFIETAGKQGYMNGSTSRAYCASIKTVMEINGEGWQGTDVRSLDPQDHLHRFHQLKHQQLNDDSRKTYEQRFMRGLELYREFLDRGYQMPRELMSRGRRKTAQRNGNGSSAQKTTAVGIGGEDHDRAAKADTSSGPSSGVKMGEYTFPLRPNLHVNFTLPMDFTRAEADRLSAHIKTYAFEQPKALEPGRSDMSDMTE